VCVAAQFTCVCVQQYSSPVCTVHLCVYNSTVHLCVYCSWQWQWITVWQIVVSSQRLNDVQISTRRRYHSLQTTRGLVDVSQCRWWQPVRWISWRLLPSTEHSICCCHRPFSSSQFTYLSISTRLTGACPYFPF